MITTSRAIYMEHKEFLQILGRRSLKNMKGKLDIPFKQLISKAV